MSADDDRISAWLDDELPALERAAFAAELAASPALQAEVESVRVVRSLVRELPLLDPPAEVFTRRAGVEVPPPVAPRGGRAAHRTAARRAHGARRRTAFGLVTVAAAWLVILGFGAGVGVLRVVPPLEAFVDRHGTAYAAGDGFTELPMPDARSLGPAMDGAPLVAAWHEGDLVQLVYADATGTISVFRQPGALDDAGMPAGAAPVEVGGMHGWTTEMHDRKVVVVTAGAAVFTVVGDMANTDHVMVMAGAVPAVHRSNSLWDRTTRGWNRLLDVVGV